MYSQIDDAIYNIDRFGFTIHEKFLTNEEIFSLKLRLDEQALSERQMGLAEFAYAETVDGIGDRVGTWDNPIFGKPRESPPLQKVSFLVNKGRVFIDFAKHDLAMAYAKRILCNMPFNVSELSGIILHCGASAQSLGTIQDLIPFELQVPVILHLVVALTDINENSGAIRLLPRMLQENACGAVSSRAVVAARPIPLPRGLH